MSISIITMIRTIDGLRGTRDVSDWEDDFIGSVVEKTKGGDTTGLSTKQVEIIERIYKKHFGGAE